MWKKYFILLITLSNILISCNKNNREETYWDACQTETPIACDTLALMFQKGYDVKKDMKKAKKYYDIACQRGVDQSCYKLMEIYEQEGEKQKEEKYRSILLKLYHQGCTEGKSDFCNSVAVIYANQKNFKMALEMIEKGLKIAPNNAHLFYNDACIKSLQNKPVQAISSLEKFMKMEKSTSKQKKIEMIQKDSDFDGIRNSQEFKKFMRAEQDKKNDGKQEEKE